MKNICIFAWEKVKSVWTLPFTQILFSGAWLSNLLGTDSEYSIYVLCTICAAMCIVRNNRNGMLEETRIALTAAVFSLMVILANYDLFIPYFVGSNLMKLVVTFLGGICVGGNILVFLCSYFPKEVCCAGRKKENRVFLMSFACMAMVFLGFHFYMNYPGAITPDSINQIAQFFTGNYNNMNPFYHTVLLELFYRIGFVLFGELNRALGFAMQVQCICLALCFGYAVVTLYQMGVPKWLVMAAFVFYTFAPYNITYASTMWKDVLFGASALLWVTAFLRILWGIGRKKSRNYLVFAVGAIGLSLMRTNGWYALLLTALLLLPLLKKEHPEVLKILASVLVICWIACNPVLDALGVSSTDLVEAFAVPFQQFSYVIANGGDLTEEETELLSVAFDFEAVEEYYKSGCVDPVKNHAYRRENQAYIRDNLGKYLSLYIKMAVKYPGSFLYAWIEETKGYWNGGYVENSYYGLYPYYVHENDWGIQKIEQTGAAAEWVADGYTALFACLERNQFFRPIFGMGLAVWLLLVCSLMCLWNKRREGILCVPILVIVIGLWIGTPVFSEFRYAYPVFTTLPVIMGVSLYRKKV